mgnify:FL=1
MERGRTSRFYAANPRAAAKHRSYMRGYNKRPGQSQYRSKLNQARRKRGIYGKGGGDMSHVGSRSGPLRRESMKINCARNGAGGRPRFAPSSSSSPRRSRFARRGGMRR